MTLTGDLSWQRLAETISRSRDMVGAHQNLNGSRELTTPLSEMVCHPWASTCYRQHAYQIEVSNSTHYEDMKDDTKCRKWSGLGVAIGSLNVTVNRINRKSTYEFLLAFPSNWPYLVPFLRYSEILVENRRFNLPHLYLAPPLGVTPLEFCRDCWHQKTTVPGAIILHCCVILHLTILVQCRLVIDGQTDRRTHNDSIYWVRNNCAFGQKVRLLYQRLE